MSVTVFTTTSYRTTVTITMQPTASNAPAPKGDVDGKEISGIVLILVIILGVAMLLACYGYYLHKRNRCVVAAPPVARGAAGAKTVATTFKRVALAVLRR